MGISHLADAVTGQSFRRGEPIVAVVIRRCTKGYPDPARTAAKPGIYPDDLFEAVSLPIHAKAGEYGDIEVSRKQVALDLVLALIGAKDWDRFCDTALNWQVGAVVDDFDIMRRVHKLPDPEPEVLGVAAFGEATWGSFRMTQARYADRQRDVAVMREVLADAKARSVGEDAYKWMSILEMRGRGKYTFSDGRRVELPHFASSLSDMSPTPVSSVLRQQLQGRAGPAPIGGTERGPKLLDEVLGSLWDAQSLFDGLRWANRYLMPSVNGGQNSSHHHVASLAFNSIECAFTDRLDRALNDDHDRAYGHAERMLAELDALRERVAGRLATAKVELDRREAEWKAECGDDEADGDAPRP